MEGVQLCLVLAFAVALVLAPGTGPGSAICFSWNDLIRPLPPGCPLWRSRYSGLGVVEMDRAGDALASSGFHHRLRAAAMLRCSILALSR